jgi:homoserine O-acetyltransferase
MGDAEIFEAGNVVLQSGLTLANARLAYKAYGRLNRGRDNAILYCTRFGGSHADNEFLIGEGKALDPERYFVVVPNLFGNGLSSSPSNTPPPQDRGRFPCVTVYDNVMVQHRLLTEVLGVRRLRLALGWSMGALQAYQWACLFPDLVERLAPIAGSAKCANHCYVFLEGMRSALTADPAWNEGWYDAPPTRGLRALGRAWAGWALSQDFYRRELYRDMGYASLEDFLIRYWEGLYLGRDANNILAMIWSWQRADPAANDTFKGDFDKALGAITAKAFVMPGETDLYFPVADSQIEVRHMANAELRVIPSAYGHYAGGGKDPCATAFLDRNLKELLAS